MGKTERASYVIQGPCNICLSGRHSPCPHPRPTELVYVRPGYDTVLVPSAVEKSVDEAWEKNRWGY